MAGSPIIWVEQGRVKRRVCSRKSSGVCPQTVFSQHMLKLHRAGEKRADAVAGGTSYFEEFSLQSTGVMQDQKSLWFVANICVFTCKCVCLSPQ